MLIPPPLLLAAFTAVDWAIVGGYLVVVIAIGAAVSRRKEDTQEFFLGNRRSPGWAVALSLLATALSAATFIGAPQEAFAGNMSYLILNLGQVLGVLIVAFLFLPALYRAGTITIYGYLGQRFGPGAATAASVAFLVGRLLASGARLFMAGLAFSLILYGDVQMKYLISAIILFGVVGTAYTASGGIKAVIWTDTLQIIVVIGSVLLALVLLWSKIDAPWQQVVDVIRTDGPDGGSKLKWLSFSTDPAAPYTLWTALAITLFNIAAYGTDHDMAQRLMTCRSPGRAIASLLGAIALSLPVTALFLLMGIGLFIFYRHTELVDTAVTVMPLDDTRVVYPQFLLNQLPTGLRGLAMAGLFAAAMSSLDSAINAMASSAVGDLRLPVGNRTMVILMGALLIAFAIGAAVFYDPRQDRLIPFALGVMTIAYGGLLGVFLTALMTRRGNTASVTAALIAGAAAVILCQNLPTLTATMNGAGEREPGLRLAFAWWMAIGTAVSFSVCALGRPAQPQGAGG